MFSKWRFSLSCGCILWRVWSNSSCLWIQVILVINKFLFSFIFFQLKCLKSSGECIQRAASIVNFLNLYGPTCNGKPSCRITPSSTMTLNNCGAKAASYFHVDYVCSKGLENKLKFFFQKFIIKNLNCLLRASSNIIYDNIKYYNYNYNLNYYKNFIYHTNNFIS